MTDHQLLNLLESRSDVDDTEEIVHITKLRAQALRASMEHDANKNREPERCEPGECDYGPEADCPVGLIHDLAMICDSCGWSKAMSESSIILWTISPDWNTIPPGRKLESVSGEVDA